MVSDVVYHDVDSYQSLLNIMPTIEKKIRFHGMMENLNMIFAIGHRNMKKWVKV